MCLLMSKCCDPSSSPDSSQAASSGPGAEDAFAAPKAPTTARATGCCGGATQATSGRGLTSIDWMLWGSAAAVTLSIAYHVAFGQTHAPSHAHGPLHHFTSGASELFFTMWWGIALGIVFVGLLDRVPREIVFSTLGGGQRLTGILRATAAGVLFDLCSHGILMVGMKLYERGASIGQTVAFLLASPWNSLSLTIVLIALIGWELTLAFVVLSAVIAVVTGWIFDGLVAAGRLPDNPARLAEAKARAARADGDHTTLLDAVRTWLSGVQPSWSGAVAVLRDGLSGSRMVLRWLLFGIVLASAVRALVPAETFQQYFGATMLGVLLTVIAATIIEVCSEGSAPIAADLVTRADAPGNGFTFLMAGVATDYTEIMSLKDTTSHWSLALMLPVISVPQTLAIGVMLNAL